MKASYFRSWIKRDFAPQSLRDASDAALLEFARQLYEESKPAWELLKTDHDRRTHQCSSGLYWSSIVLFCFGSIDVTPDIFKALRFSAGYHEMLIDAVPGLLPLPSDLLDRYNTDVHGRRDLVLGWLDKNSSRLAWSEDDGRLPVH
jgi:hypothetical protein